MQFGIYLEIKKTSDGKNTSVRLTHSDSSGGDAAASETIAAAIAAATTICFHLFGSSRSNNWRVSCFCDLLDLVDFL